YADANQKDAGPALPVHPLSEEEPSAQCARDIAQRRDWHDEADVINGQNRQQREKPNRHEPNPDPHPLDAQSTQNYLDERSRAKIVDLADRLHGARDAKLTRGAGDYDQRKKEDFEHD